MEEEGDGNLDEKEVDLRGKKRKKRKTSELVCDSHNGVSQFAVCKYGGGSLGRYGHTRYHQVDRW